jgi:hypothetical protein
MPSVKYSEHESAVVAWLTQSTAEKTDLGPFTMEWSVPCHLFMTRVQYCTVANSTAVDRWSDEIKSKHLVKLLCKTLNLMHGVDINGCRGQGSNPEWG